MTLDRRPAIADRALGLVTPARLIMTIFTLHAFVMTNWFPRIPDMQAKLGVGPGALSLGVLGTSIGTLVALPFAGAIVERFTPRRTIMVAFVLYALAFTVPGWAWDIASLFVALFVYGLCLPIVDVAMNVEADRIERTLGRRIMNTCHGFWSVGSILGVSIGSIFASLAVAPRWHMLIVSAISVPIALVVARALPDAPATESADQRPPGIALPTLALAGLCAFAFGMLVTEGAALDWSGIFLRDVVGASPATAGFGFTAFTVFMAIGRFFGDHLANRFGPVALARSCAIICLCGVAAMVSATTLIQAVIGLAATGLGVSVAVPLAISAAADRGDRPAAVNVAALSLVSFSGFLVEPPLVGYGSEIAGIRIGFALVIPAIVMSIVLSGHVYRRTVAARSPVTPLSEIAT